MNAGSFLDHVCPAVGCPGRHSRKPGPRWCRCSISERRNWLFLLGHRAVKVVGCCPGVQAPTAMGFLSQRQKSSPQSTTDERMPSAKSLITMENRMDSRYSPGKFRLLDI